MSRENFVLSEKRGENARLKAKARRKNQKEKKK